MNCKVCGNTSAKNSSVSFFRFPKESAKCRKWAERCDLLALFEKHGTTRFYKSFRVCSNHFDPKDVVFDGRKKRLLQSAMPQVSLPIKSSKEMDMKDFDQNKFFKLNLVENLCRLCAEENKNLTDIYGWKGRILKLEDKLKYLPLVISEYDILPLRVCCICVSKVNQFHDFILSCMKAETKLRIMCNLEDCNMSNNECQEDMDVNFNKTPNFDLPDSSDVRTCFQENSEYEFCNESFQDNFINELGSSCICKESKPEFPEANQLTSHTNIIKKPEFSSNNFRHDYGLSNTSLRNQFQDEAKNQIVSFEVVGRDFKEIQGACLIQRTKNFGGADFWTLLLRNILNEPEANPKPHSRQSSKDNQLSIPAIKKPKNISHYEIGKNVVEETKHSCDIFLNFFPNSDIPNAQTLINSVNIKPNLNTPLLCEPFQNVFFTRPSNIYPKSDEKTFLKCFLKCGKKTSNIFCNLNRRNIQTDYKFEKKRCRFCDMQFENRQLCLIHEKTHGVSGETSHECKLCGKEFRSRASLRQHRSVHSDKRVHRCKECGMSFKRKDTLSNHLRIHTGERPFVCKVCGFAFKQRGDCIKHEKNHQKTCEREIKEKNYVLEVSPSA